MNHPRVIALWSVALRWSATGLVVVLIGVTVVRGWTAWERHRELTREVAPPPAGMVLVPAGWFWMGTDDPKAPPDERPLRRVFLPAYYIDRTEVTNREFQRFQPEHTFPAGAEDLPATHVFKHEAKAYARWAGKRLPPAGDEFDTNRCNMRPRQFHTVDAEGRVCLLTNAATRGKLPVGSYPEGASPYGCLDMCGNVWEWVSTVHRDETWFGLLGEPTERGILRGGAWGYGPHAGTTFHQAFEPLNATCNDTGFRCVKEIGAKR
jgi:formylglycine-generating enzyme required for sulfatase activity